MIRCVVFDYDGTLADSNRIKREAWFQVFARVGATPAETAALLGERPTADRYDLIGAMLERLGALERSADGHVRSNPSAESWQPQHADVTVRAPLAAELAQAYNDLCEAGQATCPEMPGAAALLAALVSTHSLYLNSATPEEPLRRIVTRRGWAPFFRGIFGRPRDKADILRTVLAAERLGPAELAMVGDGPADWQCAREVGCPFFAVGELTDFPYGRRVNHLADLPAALAAQR